MDDPMLKAYRRMHSAGTSKRQKINEARRMRMKSAAINSRLRRSTTQAVEPAVVRRIERQTHNTNLLWRVASIVITFLSTFSIKRIL